MFEHIDELFDGMTDMMKGLKKAAYEKRMDSFRKKNGHFFWEMIQYVEAKEEKESAAEEIGNAFTEAVEKQFSVKGKMRSRMQADLNFFMIYYVFPALLLERSEYDVLIADHIRDAWGARFKDSKIQYADYDRIYSTFREKILGIF